VRLAASW